MSVERRAVVMVGLWFDDLPLTTEQQEILEEYDGMEAMFIESELELDVVSDTDEYNFCGFIIPPSEDSKEFCRLVQESTDKFKDMFGVDPWVNAVIYAF